MGQGWGLNPGPWWSRAHALSLTPSSPSAILHEALAAVTHLLIPSVCCWGGGVESAKGASGEAPGETYREEGLTLRRRTAEKGRRELD